jgi:succinoglycan biosynthesis transport protein ExoP
MDNTFGFERGGRASIAQDASLVPASPLHVVGLREFVSLLRRRKYFIAVFVLACLALLLIALSTMRNSYTATSALVMERNDTPMLEAVTELQGEVRDRSAMETEMDIITSRIFAGRVVDAMNLVEHPWFNTYLPAANETPGWGSWLWTMLGLGDGDARKMPPVSVQRDRAISTLLSRMAVTRTGESLAVSVHVSSPDPELSASIANTIASTYVEWSRSLKKVAMTDAVNFLRDRAAQVAARIAQNERTITEFSRANELASDARDDILRQRIDGMNTQLTAARVELAGIRSRLEQGRLVLAGGGDIEGTTLTSPLLVSIRDNKATLMRERAQFAANLGLHHPEVVKADAQLASVDEMIAKETRHIVEEIAGEEAITAGRVQQLEAQIGELRTAVRQRSLAEIRLRELERDLLADQKLHDLVVGRLGGLDPYAEVAKPSARVVSIAAVPTEPSFPQRSRILGGGLVGAGVLAVILAIMIEAVDTRIRSGQRIQQATGIPNLSSLPRQPRHWLQHGPTALAQLVESPRSMRTESLRALYLTCRVRLPVAKPTLLIASTLPGEGAGEVALGFAYSAARDGVSTLLVDFDPQPSELSGIPAAPEGYELHDVLAGDCRLVDAVRPVPEVPGLDVLTACRTADARHMDMRFHSDDMHRVMEDVRNSYDMILIHSAPVLILEDANWLQPFVDAVLLVVRFGQTTEQELTNAVSRLQLNHAPLIGTVLNGVEPHAQPGQEMLGAMNHPRQARDYLQV